MCAGASIDLLQPIEAADSLSAPPLVDPDGRVIATADGVSVAADVLRPEALASRPDLRAARHARERADLEIQWRALGVPNVTAAWGYRNDFGAHAMGFEVSRKDGRERADPTIGHTEAAGVVVAYSRTIWNQAC